MNEIISKKTIIILVVTVIALLSITITLKYLFVNNTRYIVIDDYIVEYDKNGYKKANLDDVKDYRFRMLQNKNYIGNYSFDHIEDDIERLFFRNEEGVNAINVPLLGLDENTEYINYTQEELTEEDFNLYKSVVDMDVNYHINDLSYANKYVISNNKKTYNVYAIKYEGKTEQDNHSIIFASTDKKVVVLDEDFPQEEEIGYLFYSFDLEYVLDINKDNKYELVVSKSHYDLTDYSIYELNDTFNEVFYTGE